MEQYKKWLEEQIEVTLEDKELQREHWAYCTAYKKLIEALPIHGVMQAEASDGAEGAAVASEGNGEANTCADAGCPQCRNTDIYDIDDHWTKCNNCGFSFVG